MSQDKIKELARIRELAAPFVESLGLSVWGLEIAGGDGRPTVRLFIESAEGVDVEQCAKVSRQLGLAMDMEDVIHGAYQLEVSSPGLERRFFEISQLAPYVGRDLDITLAEPLGKPLEGRKRLKGAFVSLSGETLTITFEGEPVSFPWSDVTRVRLVHEFETPEASKARARKTSKADKAAARDKA